MSRIQVVYRLSRPIQILFALLTYGLGLGLARYLGNTLRFEPQIFGGVIVILLLAASNLLTEYFRPFNEPLLPPSPAGESMAPKEREELRALLLTISAAVIALACVLALLLQHDGFIQADTALVLAAFILLALANAIPPVRLFNRGLGEFSSSLLISSLTPTLAFLLQTHNIHRLLALFTFPLFLITLSYFLSMNFPVYADDLKYARRSMLVALTWQRAVPVHNGLLIAAYLVLAAAPFLGVAFGLVWPALLTLPLAAYHIFTLRNIAEGAKPLWTAFIVTATAIMGLSAYLLTLTFWLR